METPGDRFTAFQNARALTGSGTGGGLVVGRTRVKRRYLVYTALAIAAFLIFQFFFRYQYIEADGRFWRIDRLTQQSCEVVIGHAVCTPVSTSPSTSTSLSTSLSVSPGKK